MALVRRSLLVCSCRVRTIVVNQAVRQVSSASAAVKAVPATGGDLLLQVGSLSASKCFLKEYSSMTSAEQVAQEETERLLSLMTLKVRSSDEAVLDSYTQFVTRAAKVLQLDVGGKVVLPTFIEKRTLLKSPHIYKKHRAQYELRTHGRMVQLRQVTGNTADIFLEYIQRNLPEGVSMSVEETALEELPIFVQRSGV